MIKKLFVLLLGVCFAFPAAVSGEAGASARFQVYDYPGACAVKITLRDEMFSQDAFTYQHGLCQASLSLAQAAFGDAEGRQSLIVPYLTDLGFHAVETCQYDVTAEDSIGTAMGWRYLDCFETPAPLVVIAVRGGYYGDEWLSNFNVGDGSVHAGFLSAARQTLSRVRDYLTATGLENEAVRFWLTGYSRGAAVANLTAALLVEEGIAFEGGTYAYTFATPRTVRGELKGLHPFIFNIVNPNDLVPMMPLAAWDYGWYGRTLYLPADRDDGALTAAYAEAFRALTGREPWADQDSNGLAEAMIQGFLTVIPSPDQYTDTYRTMLGKLVTGRPLDGAETMAAALLGINVLNSVSKAEGIEASLYTASGPDAPADAYLGLAAAVLHQHFPDCYTAWLMSLPDGGALTENALTGSPDI